MIYGREHSVNRNCFPIGYTVYMFQCDYNLVIFVMQCFIGALSFWALTFCCGDLVYNSDELKNNLHKIIISG